MAKKTTPKEEEVVEAQVEATETTSEASVPEVNVPERGQYWDFESQCFKPIN